MTNQRVIDRFEKGMIRFFKKFMAFFTLISVLSTSAWAFSPEVLFDDAISVQAKMQDVHLINRAKVDSTPNSSNAQMPEQFCDHACHISAHITAIEVDEITNKLPKLDSATFKIESKDQLTNPVLKSLYRPPALV